MSHPEVAKGHGLVALAALLSASSAALAQDYTLSATAGRYESRPTGAVSLSFNSGTHHSSSC